MSRVVEEDAIVLALTLHDVDTRSPFVNATNQASDSDVREAVVEGDSEIRADGGTTRLADGQNATDQLWPQLGHSNSTSSPKLVTSLSTRSPVSSSHSGQSGSVTARISSDSRLFSVDPSYLRLGATAESAMDPEGESRRAASRKRRCPDFEDRLPNGNWELRGKHRRGSDRLPVGKRPFLRPSRSVPPLRRF